MFQITSKVETTHSVKMLPVSQILWKAQS